MSLEKAFLAELAAAAARGDPEEKKRLTLVWKSESRARAYLDARVKTLEADNIELRLYIADIVGKLMSHGLLDAEDATRLAGIIDRAAAAAEERAEDLAPTDKAADALAALGELAASDDAPASAEPLAPTAEPASDESPSQE